MNIYYKLDKDKNVLPSSAEEYKTLEKESFPTNHCHVKKETINDYDISTIFMGIDHGFVGAPFVFETMIFDKHGHGIYQDRYSTWNEAEKGHDEAIRWLKEKCEGK